MSMQGGIPKPSELMPHYNRDELKGLPFTFPTKTIRLLAFIRFFVEDLKPLR